MTARNRDYEANRLTHNEVKNGLLASIGLCDGLSDLATQSKATQMLERLSTIAASEHEGDLRQLSSTVENVFKIAKVR